MVAENPTWSGCPSGSFEIRPVQIVLPAVFKRQRGLTLQKIWHRSLDETWHHAARRRKGQGQGEGKGPPSFSLVYNERYY